MERDYVFPWHMEELLAPPEGQKGQLSRSNSCSLPLACEETEEEEEEEEEEGEGVVEIR